MSRIVFDIETDGFLESMTKVHCIVTFDLDTREIKEFTSDVPGSLAAGLQYLTGASEIIGHFIKGFDIPALQKIYPGFKPKGKVTDTLIMSHLVYPNIKEKDFARNVIPMQLRGRHSLESWGARLGFPKGTYAKDMKDKGLDPWAELNPEMLAYCVKDVQLNVKLYEMFMQAGFSQQSFDLEHTVWDLCTAQTVHGCAFDENAANELYLKLSKEKWEIEEKLKKSFSDWWVGEEFTPKRDNKTRGYVAGVPLSRLTRVEFNPGSRDHIGDRLMQVRGWTPKKFGSNGKPTIDETILKPLKYPEIPPIMRSLMLGKRIGQIAEGKKAWLKLVKNGRIHGRVNTNGAITGRATHDDPNLGQVPAVRAEFGRDCRALFRASPGMVVVGADASGIELRLLGHYLAHYDDGAYARIVSEGTQAEGTDAHTMNQKAAGLPTRDEAKTFIYALLYGAGDFLLGGGNRTKGKRLREKFMRAIPAFRRLSKGVSSAAEKRGYLKGLDGRKIWIRHAHAALNTLLQGAGAVVMKQAMVNYHQLLKEQGIPFYQILWIHDEFQSECLPEHADAVGKSMVEGIRMTTQQFNLRCPMDGDYKVGATWADTH